MSDRDPTIDLLDYNPLGWMRPTSIEDARRRQRERMRRWWREYLRQQRLRSKPKRRRDGKESS